MKRIFGVLLTLALALGLAGVAMADVNFTASFEGGTCYGDANSLGYPNIAFSNVSLLYLSQGCLSASFPPHSGDGVAFDYPGVPMVLTLSEIEGQESGDGDTVSGYFTTNSDITMQAFASGSMCDSVFFQGPNYVGSGGTPNQFLSVHCSEIDTVVIFSSTGPNSFTLDDLTYPISDSSIPEPATLVLVSTGLLGVLRKKSWM